MHTPKAEGLAPPSAGSENIAQGSVLCVMHASSVSNTQALTHISHDNDEL